MSDDPVKDAIQLLGRPAEPRAEFGEELFLRLLQETDGASTPESAPPGRRTPRWRRRSPRLAFGAAALALAAVVAAVLTLTLSRSPSALAIIQETQKAFADVPPFRATVFYDLNPEGAEFPPDVPQGATATMEISYRGPTGYREETLEMSPVLKGRPGDGAGSFTVWDGERIGQYRAAENIFTSFPPWAGFEPLREFSWNAPYPNWEDICARADSEVLPDAEIAGRAARHVRCGDWRGGSWELWIDRETGLMLKIVGTLGGDDFRLGTTPKGGFEVTSIEYDPVFPSGTFAVVAPAGAKDTTVEAPSAEAQQPPAETPPPGESTIDPYSQTSLKAGEVAPTWTAPLVGGGNFSPEELRGRPALVLVMSDWCPLGDHACDAMPHLQQVYGRWKDRVGFAWVDLQGTMTEAERIARDIGITFPVVVDVPDQGANEFGSEVTRAWDVKAFPLWVLLDADGRVVEVLSGPSSVEELDDVLAKAAG
jgi:thiol-disulfide isomerase/thioredoxin